MSRILYLPNCYSQQRQREKKVNIYPVLLAMEATYYEEQRIHEVTWNEKTDVQYDKVITEPEGIPFLSLPHPNRHLTGAMDSIYQRNGNFKYHPGTYIQSASGCSHGRCIFCVENGKPYEVRKVEDVISEIEECKSLGFKEVFDDSATFPTGDWLERFMGSFNRFNGGIRLSCNIRINSAVDFKAMRDCGFRMLLFGIESSSQYTLDKINKGVKVEDIIPTIRKAAESGLEPHIAVMFGYPWESVDDASNTLRLVHYLLRKGYAKTAQASLYCPQGHDGNEAFKKYVKKIYNVGYDPRFWWVRRNEDVHYLWRGIKSAFSFNNHSNS